MSEIQINKDPSILNYVPAKKLEAIKECYRDEDGYWIILNEGWEASNMDSGCRTIHEDNIKQLRYQISGIQKVNVAVADPAPSEAPEEEEAAQTSEQPTEEAPEASAEEAAQPEAPKGSSGEAAWLFLKASSRIDGRSVWLYLIETPIGSIYAVEYEMPDGLLKRFLFDSDFPAAEKKYKALLCSLVKGTL